MALDYSEIIDAVEKHIEVVIMGTTPSRIDKSLPSWKRFKGEHMENSTRRTRLFDIIHMRKELFFTGNGTEDYDAYVHIRIEYGDDEHLNKLADSDYVKIKTALDNSDKSELHAAGFNLFYWEDDSDIEEPDDDNEYRIMTLPVVCRVTVTL